MTMTTATAVQWNRPCSWPLFSQIAPCGSQSCHWLVEGCSGSFIIINVLFFFAPHRSVFSHSCALFTETIPKPLEPINAPNRCVTEFCLRVKQPESNLPQTRLHFLRQWPAHTHTHKHTVAHWRQLLFNHMMSYQQRKKRNSRGFLREKTVGSLSGEPLVHSTGTPTGPEPPQQIQPYPSLCEPPWQRYSACGAI